MCGIVALFAQEPVNQLLFDALTVLQHRGQDAAGIMTCDTKGHLYLRKGKGLVRDVFHTRHMLRLQGNMGIGHVRYPTAGGNSEAEAQPFYVNSPYGISLAHNGNLTNATVLKQQVFKDDLRHVNTSSDSEVLLNVFAHQLQSLRKMVPTKEDMFEAVKGVFKRCRGAYAVVTMVTGHGIVAFRDPNGIRPLCYGIRHTDSGKQVMVASESVALASMGFADIQDVKPGEAIFVDQKGDIHKHICAEKVSHNPCIFEFVYLARPDSIIDQISVYKVRRNVGKRLADQITKEWGNHDIDVVIPIPETSRGSAIALASRLGIKFREGFVKNRYIGRTFIMPGQAVRKRSVRQKLNAIGLEFKDKNVLLVDDSIVRGTTSQEIIQLAREAGANKVYFASASPPVCYPNLYGIDMPVSEELIAYNRSVDEIRQYIGADKLIYAKLEHLIEAAQEGNSSITKFDCSVFDGLYVTGDEKDYIAEVRKKRSESSITLIDDEGDDLTGLQNDAD